MQVRFALASICAPMLMLASGAALAGPYVGPVYPPPGGVTFSSNGIPAISSGQVATYQNFDLSQSSALYFAITNVGLAMDGTIDASGETLTFNAALSDLANGIAVFTGTTTVNNFGVNQTAYTKFTLAFTDFSNNPLALIIDPNIAGGLIPALLVQGNYNVGESFAASSSLNGTYTAAGSYYDALHTPNTPNLLQSSFSGGFYYIAAAVPEPGSWGLMLLGFAGTGMALRRSRRSQTLLTQLA